MGCAEKIKMGNRSSCLNILLCLMVVMCFFSHTANAALKCKSGETFASADTLACLTCIPQCESACPKGSTVTKTNCNLIRFLAPPLCECCCKVPPPPPSPPPPSPPPPPPSPPPPSPSPPPPSPPPPPPSPPPPSPSPPPPSPPPPSPSPPPPSPPPPSPSPPPPSPPPPLICKAGEPYESFTCGPTTECTCCSNNCKIRCGWKNTTVETESCRKFTSPAGSPTVACQCCCKKPPSPPPPSPSPPPPSPSPPPPSPPPPPPSPPPPSPSPPPPSPPPPSPSPPSPSPPPPSPSPPPPPSPSPPPPPSCPEVCPSEFQFQLSPDQPPCTYKLASQIMIM